MDEKQYPPINERIRARRLELGFSDVEMAHQARLSIYEYGDVEAHADEVFVVVPLYHVKKLCGVLKTDFFTLFETHCAFCEEGMVHPEDYWLRRDSLVRKKREALGLSTAELGDKIGFYGTEIELIETYTAHLESWVIENIFELATQLQIPPQVLLDIWCPKCGQ
jgi:hypothetical protein